MTTLTPDNLTPQAGMTNTPATPDPMTAPAANGIIQSAATSLPQLKATAAQSTSDSTSMLSKLAGLQTQDDNKANDTSSLNEADGVNSNTDAINSYKEQLAQITGNINSLGEQSKAIPLQTQNNNANTGATDAGVAPQDASALRENAINALDQAAQADTLNGKVNASGIALQAAQAKVTQAINLKYAPIEAQISDLQNQLQLNKEYITDPAEKQIADNQTIVLAQRAQDVSNAKDLENNLATIAQEALKNGAPSSVASQITSSGSQADGITAAGKYLTDSTALALEQANLQKVQLENTKARQDAAINGESQVVQTNPVTGQTTTIPINIAPYYNTSSSGVPYVDLSNAVGTAAEKTSLVNDAQKNGVKVILNKNEAADVNNIGNALSDIQSIQGAISGIAASSPAARDTYQAGTTTLEKFLQTDPQKAAFGVFSDSALDILKAVSGLQGFRGNASAIAQVKETLPQPTDTIQVANQKIQNLQSLIQNRENAIVGVPDPLSSIGAKGSKSDTDFVTSSVNSSGKTYNQIIQAIPSGQIPVVDNTSGSIGYIPPSEYDSSKYTKL